MLISLRIENFAIVSQLELDFTRGMTTFTGETGAGKSIMIDALMLALGERTDASVIRMGAEKCEIHACFSFDPGSRPAQWLSEHDITHTDGEILLRRSINTDGRSKSYINGQPFPLQKIKELSEMLVDIHGQHQHQTLLQHATHRQQLDQYANHQPLQDNVKQCYRQCQDDKQALERLQNRESTDEWVELLLYQIDELTGLSPQEGEIEALHAEHQLLHHAREFLECAQKITAVLAAEEQPNVRQNLNYALQWLTALPQSHPQIQTTTELLNASLIHCDEALDEIDQFSTQVQLDPERLAAVESRMSDLHHAARKYHIDVSQLPAHALYLQNELTRLRDADKEQQQLQQRYDQSQHSYQQAALALRASRQQSADKLAAEITAIIRQLGMPKGFVTVEITALDKMQVHGLDKVEYQVCANPGTVADTLGKIASGGELSRISLGIQMITAQRGTTPTLVFDEVDVGIGGATAALVGQMLRNLGERLQVFCVTHQPQVASCAHQHFRVEKYTEQEHTFSTVTPLNHQEKIDEIARMLGGLTITEQTRSNARELLTQHRETSNIEVVA